MSERYSSFEPKGTRWFFQRITAALLVVLLALHFIQLHFVNHAAEVTFAGTRARMSNIFYFSTMVLFLITAAFHGVNGVYNALVNQGLTGTPKTVIKWGLIVSGTVLVLQGIRVAFAMAGPFTV
jgi:succinate dehydrogenase / fumarate reductase membrane anchor subunit